MQKTLEMTDRSTGGTRPMSESGKCHFGGSGIGKGAKFRVGNREKNSFWDRENGILEGRESDLFFSLREKQDRNGL